MGKDMSAGSSGKRINNPMLFPFHISLKDSGKDLSVLSMKLVRISDLIHSKQKAASSFYRFSILQTATNIDQPSSHHRVSHKNLLIGAEEKIAMEGTQVHRRKSWKCSVESQQMWIYYNQRETVNYVKLVSTFSP